MTDSSFLIVRRSTATLPTYFGAHAVPAPEASASAQDRQLTLKLRPIRAPRFKKFLQISQWPNPPKT